LIGGSQENNRRAGTENVASIVALGKAAECAMGALADEETRVRALRDRFETSVLKTVPGSAVNGGAAPRRPITRNLPSPAGPREPRARVRRRVAHRGAQFADCAHQLAVSSWLIDDAIDPQFAITLSFFRAERIRENNELSLVARGPGFLDESEAIQLWHARIG